MLQVGIDFGTTNSVIALLGDDGAMRSAMFGTDDVFRSVLCFWAEDGKAGQTLRHAAGPAAIDTYLDDPLDSRIHPRRTADQAVRLREGAGLRAHFLAIRSTAWVRLSTSALVASKGPPTHSSRSACSSWSGSASTSRNSR